MASWEENIRKTQIRNERKIEAHNSSRIYETQTNKIFFRLFGIFAIGVALIVLYIIVISLTGEAKLGF